ncbi:class I SAM-dependent methyltransferase [Solihabitans fulvus]|uniref:Class I SAM-dependent methyltransferase n=1 Tax=Solihabitans fulvus TaxID=1892852 RepID=A0A5B2WHQ4_9PSEU|nr:methyltransferase [Solihabitans fulvus]KAA2250182.1 class I SAM-dependent methyltransferase [Solihabitans fulvus]
MDRQKLSALAHTHHPIASPLTDDTVLRLLDRAVQRPDAHLLDLGCGSGEWLLRALAAHDRVTAIGVDLSTEGFAEARERARELGVADRLDLRQQDASEYRSDRPADVVLCVGATHAFGGLLPTLAAIRPHLADGGVAMVGEAFWEREPNAATLAEFEAEPDTYADLAGTVDQVVADGWTPVYGHASTAEELDEYEWSWTGSLAQWALDNPGHPDSAQALEVATSHRDGWLKGYRGIFGFVTLVLRRTS